MPHLGELAAIATAALWTLSSVAWTSAGKHAGALPISFIRLLVTCVLLAAYGQAARSLPFPTDASARTWLVLGASGFLGFFLTDLCLFKAFLLIGPRLALLVFSLSPPLAALAAWPALGDKLAAKEWGAMAVTLAGVVWVVLEQPDGSRRLHYLRPEHYRLGIALAAAAAVGNAAALVLSKEGIGQYDAFAATFIRVLGALAGYLPMITLLRRWPATARTMRHGRAMLIIAAGSVVGPFLGVAMYMTAVRHAQAGVVATIIATMPVMILPLVVWFYGERVSPRAALGAVVSAAGVGLLMLQGPASE